MRIALGLLTVACSVVVLHCSAGLPYVCHGAIECGLEPDGGPDGGADVVVPPGCDPTKSPKESPACVTDDFGVFVSPLGKDGATGKKTDPLRSIAEAVGKGKPRVYVCEGTYDANVAITTPVAIYGGLTCLWEPSETARPKLAPPKGIALRVTKVAGAVEIADLDVVGSADANTPGDSAIAAFVSESDGVTFRRTNLTAGAGTAGTKGASRLNYAGATATKGANGSGGTAGGPTSCSCADGTMSTGGAGASGAGAGIQNGTANPAVGGANAGSTSASTCGGGLPGANGLAAGGGAPAASPGTLSAEGWNSSTSANAQNGNPAQGGGGGGAKTDVTSAGGGGGCGGCGGAGGARGTNGGSSFAVLSFNSGVTIESGSAPSGLTSGPGGRGGDGGDGQVGQGPGGAGTGPACNGGAGGSGAGGSGGGGGAGGHSVPVAFVGTEPKVTRATVTPGAKGAAGPGGAAGAGPDNAGAPGTPGPEGKAQTTLAL